MQIEKKSLYQIYVYSFLRQCVVLVYFVWTELSQPLFFTSPSPCVVCKLTSQEKYSLFDAPRIFLGPHWAFLCVAVNSLERKVKEDVNQ